jgi:hypothetical protein
VKMEVRRTGIVLIPEGVQDEVFLESALGLKQAWDTATVHRVPASGLPAVWAYAEIRRTGALPLSAPKPEDQT